MLRGINLGGWLVLERWMTPSVFDGTDAPDEYTLCKELGEKKHQVLKHHRDTFVTKKDFQWIAKQDFDAVRLPVGHWLFESPEPYVAADQYVAEALKWAKSSNLKVIIDLHTAPGSQNGSIHSGRRGETLWRSDAENVEHTIDVISEIAETYGNHTNLYGIELLNEPHRDTSLRFLQDFYTRAYDAVRAHSNSNVAVIISDAYRPIAEWEDFVHDSKFENMLLDIHLYQTFGDKDKLLTFDQHIAKVFKWQRMIETFGSDKILVGEWSVVLDKTFDSMDLESAQRAKNLYAQTQRHAFENTAGHFYWNYKTEQGDDWSYRDTLLNY